MRTRTIRRLGVALVALALLGAACSSDDADDAVDDGDDSAQVGTEGSTLQAVLDRGELICGVSGAATAFSTTQPDGSQEGIDADYCRVVAAAVLGDSGAVTFVPLTSAERFTALGSGSIDVLFRNTTWTQSRDTELGLNFGPTTFYDGQQVLTRASDGFSVSSQISDLDGSVVCTAAGTTTEKNIAEAADLAGISITLLTFEGFDEIFDNFVSRACDAVTSDGSNLIGRRAVQEPDDQEWVLFPSQPISKEPLGPAYRHGDDAWGDIIDWSVNATIIADEYGVTAATAQAVADDPTSPPEMLRLFGVEGELQAGMGLPNDGFLQAIRQVGNYDEIFARNLNPVGLFREGTANDRWTDGGLIYSPPAR